MGRLDRAGQDGTGALRTFDVRESDGEGDLEVGHTVAQLVADLRRR